MTSRSINYLRKNMKVIMVFMTVVCMFTFVVGGSLYSIIEGYQRQATAHGDVVVTWVKGSLRDDELFHMRRHHGAAVRFLSQIVVTTIQRGGKPMVNGQQLGPNGPLMIGIPEDSSDQTLVQTMVLAEEANKRGIKVDQQAVKAFLRQLSSPELGEADWLEIAEQVIHNQNMTVSQIFQQLEYELKAQHMRMLAMAGVYAQRVGPIVPPGEAWELFNRFNRRLAIEAYPIEVDSLVAQVKGEPTESEIKVLFDEGKYRDPDPSSKEPGFRRPHKIAFTYLKVNFEPFLEEAKKQITEQQIEEEYQKDIGQGKHKVLELPEATPPAQNKEADKPSDEKKEGDKPAEQKKEAAAAPAPEKADAKKPVDEGKAAEPPTEKPGCGSDEQETRQSLGEVSSQAEPGNEKKAEPGNEEKTKPDGAKPDEAKTPEAKAGEEKAAEAPPAKEQKFKPLSEVREEIHKHLAQPIAEEAKKKAIAEVVSAIESFGKRYRRYLDVKNVRKNADIPEPGKLDLAAIAAPHGFPIATTPLVDRHEIMNYEIGQKVQQFDMAAAQRGQLRMLSFPEIAFNEDQPVYKPAEIDSSERDMSYVYFRTAEEKPADVTLADVRKEVVAFWKKQKAAELAIVDAKKLADKAKSATSLSEVVSEPAKVITTIPFSWMSTGSLGFGQPELSRVPGIDLAGQEFMQAVFGLKVNEAGAAPNQPHSKVYVVRVLSQTPDDEKLRTQFLDSGYNNFVVMLAQAEAIQTSVDWYRGIAEAYGVKWQRQPDEGRRM